MSPEDSQRPPDQDLSLTELPLDSLLMALPESLADRVRLILRSDRPREEVIATLKQMQQDRLRAALALQDMLERYKVPLPKDR